MASLSPSDRDAGRVLLLLAPNRLPFPESEALQTRTGTYHEEGEGFERPMTEGFQTVLAMSDKEAGGTRLFFKGGTSLSKGYGLTERFSEDIGSPWRRGRNIMT